MCVVHLDWSIPPRLESKIFDFHKCLARNFGTPPNDVARRFHEKLIVGHMFAKYWVVPRQAEVYTYCLLLHLSTSVELSQNVKADWSKRQKILPVFVKLLTPINCSWGTYWTNDILFEPKHFMWKIRLANLFNCDYLPNKSPLVIKKRMRQKLSSTCHRLPASWLGFRCSEALKWL